MRHLPASAAARLLSLLLAAALLLAAVACQRDAPAAPANTLAALPLAAPAPPDNPGSAAKVALGRALFWDPLLSGGRDVSCASCHHPAAAYADGLALAVGVGGRGHGAARRFGAAGGTAGPRNTPTVLDAAFNGLTANGLEADPTTAPMFWDNRATSLEGQSLLPIASLGEMRGGRYAEANAVDSVVARLRHVPAYAGLFRTAFGGAQPVTATTLGLALACFERTLLGTDAPFDRYMRGETTALTDEQVQGLNAFVQSGCGNCHGGPMLSDYQLHVLGVADNPLNTTSDTGAGGRYAFRTPSLRNVARTAPYMHSGTLATLEQVLDFYDPGRGNQAPPNPHVSAGQRDAQFPGRVNNKAAIVAFLRSLSAGSFDQTVPVTVPSGLAVGGK